MENRLIVEKWLKTTSFDQNHAIFAGSVAQPVALIVMVTLVVLVREKTHAVAQEEDGSLCFGLEPNRRV